MGSHSTQGIGISVFLLAFVSLACFLGGWGVIFLLAFLALFGISVYLMRKCRAMEEAAE